MVRAWFMADDDDSDQRLEHHRSPPEFVDMHKLLEITGVEHFKVRTETRAFALCKWRLILRREKCSNAFSSISRYSLKFHVQHAINTWRVNRREEEASLMWTNCWIIYIHTIVDYHAGFGRPLSAIFPSIRENQNDFTIHSNIHSFTRFQ